MYRRGCTGSSAGSKRKIGSPKSTTARGAGLLSASCSSLNYSSSSLNLDDLQASERSLNVGKPVVAAPSKAEKVPRGRCSRCGIKTHSNSVFLRPLTTRDVYEGRCIRCNPMTVPCSVRNEWEIQNAALLVQDEVASVSSQEVRGFSGFSQSTLGASLNDIVACVEDSSRTASDVDESGSDQHPKPSVRMSRNRCRGCDIRTHKTILGKRFPVTTATIFEGHCLKCSPLDVPLGVLQKWQSKSLGEHAKNIPDTVDLVLHMEKPSVPSSLVIPTRLPVGLNEMI